MLPEDKLQQLIRIAGSDSGNIVTARDLASWHEKDIQKFEKEEVLLFRGYVDSIRCDRCHKGCSVNPQTARYPDGQQKGVVLCTDEDEGGRIEFEMKELRYWEINRDIVKKSDTNSPVEDVYITINEAAKMLGKARGTISRLADREEIQDNKKKGKGRQVTKTSVLLYKHKINEKDEKAEFEDFQQDIRKIPERH